MTTPRPNAPVVTYLGPSGTFTHQAVLALCPDAVAEPVTSVGEAMEAVEAGTATHAVVPIDNSVNGVVIPTLDGLVQRSALSIVDSAVVPISFNAYTVDPDVPPTVAVSHPHGLAQCRGYIESLGLATREAASTAAACRDLVPGEIGIGPAVCGTLYPIRLVREAVEDNEHAYTQFALVAPGTATVEGSGDDGLLVSLSPPANVPGILRRLLEVLEVRAVNMTNLVTRPVPATPGRFMFLLFLAGQFSADDFTGMHAEWATLGCDARVLGRISPLAELAQAHAR